MIFNHKKYNVTHIHRVRKENTKMKIFLEALNNKYHFTTQTSVTARQGNETVWF